MLIENPNSTSYLTAIILFVLSVTILKISTVESAWTSHWPLHRAEVKCKHANRNATFNFLCVVNCSVCPMCHRLRYNHVWTSQFDFFLPRKWWGTTLMKISARIYFVDMHMCAEIGAYRSSRLFPVTFRDIWWHFVTFRDISWRMHGRTHNSSHNTVPLHRNDLKSLCCIAICGACKFSLRISSIWNTQY